MILLFAIFIFTASANVFGGDIQVANADASGAGSLDQAIQDFIANGTSGTISFDPSLVGSTISITQAYNLSATSLILDGDANGDGVSDITLQSDGNSHRFFNVSGTATLTLNNLTIIDFTSGIGGVIRMSSGTPVLNINNAALNNNSSSDGGVINFSVGNVNIEKSVFNGNSASAFGGVIFYLAFSNGTTLEIENSLFSENTSSSSGGVIHKDFSANATLRHVTFANNESTGGVGGAIDNSGGSLRLENCLFVNNSSGFGSPDVNGGIDNAGGNIFGGASSVASDYFTDPANGGYNLISTSPAVNVGDNSLSTAAGITTDIVGNPVPYDGIVDLVDAGAYEFQGDPPIKFESSAVISSSTMTVTLTFNREVTGLVNSDFSSQTGDLSISSLTSPDNIEYTATFNLSDLTEKVIDTVYMDALVEDMFMNNLQAKDTFAFAFYVPLITVTNTATSGEGSLDQALQDFIDSEGTVNTVEFDPSLNGSTIMVTKSYSFSQGTLTIDGDIDDDGAIDVILQSDGANHGFFLINGSTSLNLNRLQITDFSPNSQWGPVVQVNSGSASLSVEGCEIRNISTGGFGGAVYCENGSVSIKESIFDDCTANWGGAVTIYGGVTIIENSLFINNSASNGGAIYGRNGANISVTHCTFSENSATSAGGAIYNLRNLTVGNSLFVDNSVNSTVSNIRNDATLTDNGGNIYGGESDVSNDVADYFTDAANNDFSLHVKSLAVNQGVVLVDGPSIDILDNPRIYDGTVDVADAGAYELQDNLWHVWDGATWNYNSAPTGTDNVCIEGNYTFSTNGAFSANNLEVPLGVTVTVNEHMSDGSVLVVNGSLNNLGLVHVVSGASLVTLGNVTGTGYQMDRTTTFDTNTGKYSIVGSPVQNLDFNVLGSNALIFGYDQSEVYNPLGNAGLDRFKTPAQLNQTSMIVGKGYFSAFTGDANGLVSFLGTPNTGTINVVLDYTDHPTSGTSPEEDDFEGFNLVSNPYPTAIDFTTLMSENSGADINESIYLWDDNNSDMGRGDNADYIIVNAMGNTDSRSNGLSKWDGSIRSGQGFFVKANSATNMSFSNAMKSLSNNTDEGFFRTTPTSNSIKLLLSDGESHRATIIGYADDATIFMDKKYDALSLSGGNLQLYSIQAEDHKRLGIQGLPEGHTEEIELGFKISQEGVYTISIDNINELQEMEQVLLKDHLTEKTVNLKDGAYSFTSEAVENTDRFTLQVAPSVISSIDQLGENVFYTYLTKGQLNVVFETSGFEQADFKLIDMTGKTVFQQSSRVKSNRWQMSTTMFPKNIYILMIRTDNGIWKRRVVTR